MLLMLLLRLLLLRVLPPLLLKGERQRVALLPGGDDAGALAAMCASFV
jgi:hypothetical protein